MMGDIYSAASTTLIWLGEEDDHITRAFDWLRRFQETWLRFKESPSLVDIPGGVALQARLAGNNYSEARDILQAAFGDESNQTSAFEDIWILLQRPWFMRKWVIQEVVKSKSHRLLFVAGEKYTNWVDLNSWFTFLVLSGYSLHFILSCPWGVDFDAYDDTNTHSVFVRGAILAQATISSEWPLCRLLAVTGMFKCIDPSDHIIALLGVAETPRCLKILSIMKPRLMISGVASPAPTSTTASILRCCGPLLRWCRSNDAEEVHGYRI